MAHSLKLHNFRGGCLPARRGVASLGWGWPAPKGDPIPQDWNVKPRAATEPTGRKARAMSGLTGRKPDHSFVNGQPQENASRPKRGIDFHGSGLMLDITGRTGRTATTETTPCNSPLTFPPS